MKKIVMLVGALVLCTASFAGENSNVKSGEVMVTANVEGRALEVYTGNVDFGNVSAGITVPEPNKKGVISIQGETNRRVKVIFKDGEGHVLGNDDTFELVGVNNSASKLIYNPKLVFNNTDDEVNLGQNSYTLNDQGALNFDVEGTLTVPISAATGSHNGKMVVEVEYED